jgi:hypothetical protein
MSAAPRLHKSPSILALCLVGAPSALLAAPPGLNESVSAFTGEATPDFRYSLFDLNGDKVPDAVVLLRGTDWCGSGGCTMLVLQGNSQGFKLISRSTITREPIQVLADSRNGWLTLAVTIGGGGREPGQALLTFDGKEYPLNPSMQPQASAHDLVRSQVLTFKK